MNRSGTVDSHVHIFPNMGGSSGFESVERHMQFATQVVFHRSEGRRLHDNARVVGRDWHKGEGPYELNLRGGDFGRFLWTADGMDYARYYLPPTAATSIPRRNRSSPRWTTSASIAPWYRRGKSTGVLTITLAGLLENTLTVYGHWLRSKSGAPTTTANWRKSSER